MATVGYSTTSLLPWLHSSRLPLLSTGAVYSVPLLVTPPPAASSLSPAVYLYQNPELTWSWVLEGPGGCLLAKGRRDYDSLTRCEVVLLSELRRQGLGPWFGRRAPVLASLPVGELVGVE